MEVENAKLKVLIESQATEIKELKRRYHVLREAIRLIETESEKAINDVE